MGTLEIGGVSFGVSDMVPAFVPPPPPGFEVCTAVDVRGCSVPAQPLPGILDSVRVLTSFLARNASFSAANEGL